MRKTTFISLSVSLALAFSNGAHSQTIQTVAGNGLSGFGGDGVQATATSLYYPAGVAFDATGNMYISDNFNNRIRKVDAAGVITTIAGNGSNGFAGDGGQATAAEVNYPVGITFDNAGNLYIADRYNYRIRKISTSGVITTVAGNGTGAYSGDGGQATAASLWQPYSVAVDNVGNIYIADSQNNRIRKVDASGIITTVAGNGTAGSTGDGGQATAAELNAPGTVVLDAAGNIYIAEGGGNRIRMVNASSGIITTVIGNGVANTAGDGGLATAASINSPTSLTIDKWGDLFVGETGGNVIRMVSGSTGIITTIAGNGTGGFSGDGGSAVAAEIMHPYGLAFDQSGNLFFADEFNYRVRELSGGVIGINQLSETTDIKVYPNPASNYLYISIPNANGEQDISLYNVMGQLVMNYKTKNEHLITLPFANIPSGLYILKAQLTNNNSLIKKLEISR